MKQNKINFKNFIKKGRNLVFLPFFIACFSCSHDVSKYGKVSLHNAGDRNSFIFSVNDEFLEKTQDSKTDKEHPKLSKIGRAHV